MKRQIIEDIWMDKGIFYSGLLDKVHWLQKEAGIRLEYSRRLTRNDFPETVGQQEAVGQAIGAPVGPQEIIRQLFGAVG